MLKTVNILDLSKTYKTDMCGSESFILKLENGNEIFKYFTLDVSKESRINKKIKLNELAKIDEITDFTVLANYLVNGILNEYIAGYVMNYFNGYKLDEVLTSIDDRIKIIEKLKQYILKLKEYGILYNDLHLDNILCLDNGSDITVKLIDMDNVTLKYFDKDTTSFLLQNYINLGGKDNFNAVIYALNLITYTLLTNQTSEYDIEKLKQVKTTQINNKDSITLVSQLLEGKVNTNCDNEFLIDMIKKY